ncbi:ubiquitin family protein [Emericellopsis atlantica]|uniref:Ubiquitin family protein n=1 Tax=Emericellopsis atlantica TaxID=2614577 RepID=A0A9P8CKU5_9HYPO|nr:ubiquitin family protein [Emericellopsis atlantica]KAG9250407.1 ubiquitin family protein [Emericellopsis atlantica]
MASDTSHDAAAAPASELAVKLQVISPSVGVNRPLLFPGLPASTTVKALKAKIRDALPLQPPDEYQRLIHRGRALVRDTETLLEIFGEDTIRSNEQQTMHLVVRDMNHTQAPAAPVAPAAAAAPLATMNLPPQNPAPIPRATIPIQPTPTFPRRNPVQPALGPTPGPEPARWRTEHERAIQAQYRALQRQASRPPAGGRDSPAPLGHFRESVGHNGQTYQVETIVRGPADAGLTPADVQNVLRRVDMSQATATLHSAMRRPASGPSLHQLYNRPLNPPGTTPSGRATPDPTVRSVSGSSSNPGGQGRSNVDVYILSSPEGPRGLLVNNHTSETYYTPRLENQPNHSGLRNMFYPVGSVPPTPGQPQPTPTQAPAQGQQQQAPQPQAAPQLQDGQADRDNPQEPGIPPWLIWLVPHLWLLFRLCVFVFFFTSSSTSWSRWISVVGTAVAIFIFSTGALTNVAQAAWRPIAQHLEGLLPRIERRDAAQGGPQGQQQQQQGEAQDPNPRDMAARLVAQRDRDSVFRQIERASLLFLASIAPGVAEGHIANLEAEARAERQRLEAEAEAARRQLEEQAAAAEAATDVNTDTQGEGEDGSGTERTEGQNDEHQQQPTTQADPITT